MLSEQYCVSARFGLLALAQELDNVLLACKRVGISRSHSREIKEAFEKHGAEGLAPQPQRRPRMPNQTPPELEQRILEMTEQFPTYCYVRISGQLGLIGVGVSPSTVRAVWQRHGLTLRIHRLFWVEKKAADRSGVLTDRQIRLIELHRRRTVDSEQNFEASYPGHLLGQDTYFAGTIKGVSKIHRQSVVDAHGSLAFAKLALLKAPMTAVDTLYDRVLPFCEENGAAVEHILTDNGLESCGRDLQHCFELFLAANQIQHRRTEVRSPETNGFCGRFHRAVKEEFFSVAFRETLYESLDQLQTGLDRYVDFNHPGRIHRGYCTKVSPPNEVFSVGSALLPHREAA